ncbi:hypothetical protein [Flavobacterium geliluteum]|uniref:SprT-like domain-containing protein n=1 Tax=Flavobacterium geliluteum TaxID=2816120 RepID=A0A941AW59_9FLAO|nr:hypothetical protein [Flavobacterium geliluteum]MBP4139479.1 hypothetical protein [Flavobacterium geliluteum]
MKKTKIISPILFILISFLFWNCNQDPSEQNIEKSEVSNILSNIKQENTTLDEIKNDIYLSSITQKAFKKIKTNGNSSKNINSLLFNLNLSNEVKKYSLNDYTSYTIPIINDYGNSYIFQNLVIEKDILRDAVYLVTYYPDDNYKESIKKHLLPNNNIDYTGSKKIEYLYYKRKVNIENKDTSKTGKNTEESISDENIEEPITICVETYTPKNCTNGGNHSPGQSCDPGASSGGTSGWIVSVSCTTIPSPQPPGPGPGPGCTGCVEPVGGANSYSGIYYSQNSINTNWTPQYVCVSQSSGGGCSKVVPYTPVLTIPMTDPFNYYGSVFQPDDINLLTRFEYAGTRAAIDEYLESHKTLGGGYSIETQILVNNVLDAVKNNFNFMLDDFPTIDVRASLRSPVNIDRTSINNATPEGAKFNTIYNALTTSPAFQKLFIDIFGDSNRFNVKFEIDEHVYEDNNPSKGEVNATTSQISGTNNITIKINKQILSQLTAKSQITIENAKTILHECIHAFLFIKENNPKIGIDIEKAIQTGYPNYNGQHNFMYNNMIPTMQKILSEIRDLVTTQRGRTEVESLTMHPTLEPLTSISWDWNEYYKYISLKGLDKIILFQNDFPILSDKLRLYSNYISYGAQELDR